MSGRSYFITMSCRCLDLQSAMIPNILCSFPNGWTTEVPGPTSIADLNWPTATEYFWCVLQKVKTVRRLKRKQVRDVARGLSYLHEKGFVHSDIKAVKDPYFTFELKRLRP